MPQKTQTKTSYGKILSQWGFLEFTPHQRSASWYLWLGLISAGLIIYSIFTLNFLFGLFIILADIIFITSSKRKPNKIEIFLTEDGLKIDKNFYSYKDLDKFWFIYEPPKTKNLYFEFKNKFKPRLIIPLENQNPVNIRKILLKYLSEDLKQENESLGEQFEKWLKL